MNLSNTGKGVNLSLPYQIVNGDTVKSEGVLEFENGIASISLPTGCAMKSSKMPTGLSYIITHRPDSNFTWQKDTMEGTTDLSGSTVQFIAGQIYNPLILRDSHRCLHLRHGAFKVCRRADRRRAEGSHACRDGEQLLPGGGNVIPDSLQLFTRGGDFL